MAQGLLSAALPQAQVQSAGLGALVGMPADETAIRLMQQRGFDITGHRAQQVTRALCTQAELVLVMDSEQKRRVEQLYRELRGRVFRLNEHSKQDIADPYGRGPADFTNALALITQGVNEWRRRIEKL